MMRLVHCCTFRIGKFVNAIVAGGGNCTRSTCCAQVVVGFSSLAWRSTCCRSGIEPSHFPYHSFQIVPVTHSSGSKYFSGKSDDKINGRNEEDVEVEFVNVTSKKKTHVDINDLDLEKFTHEVKVRMPDVGDSEGMISLRHRIVRVWIFLWLDDTLVSDFSPIHHNHLQRITWNRRRCDREMVQKGRWFDTARGRNLWHPNRCEFCMMIYLFSIFTRYKSGSTSLSRKLMTCIWPKFRNDVTVMDGGNEFTSPVIYIWNDDGWWKTFYHGENFAGRELGTIQRGDCHMYNLPSRRYKR